MFEIAPQADSVLNDAPVANDDVFSATDVASSANAVSRFLLLVSPSLGVDSVVDSVVANAVHTVSMYSVLGLAAGRLAGGICHGGCFEADRLRVLADLSWQGYRRIRNYQY